MNILWVGVQNFITLTSRPILIIFKKMKSTNRFRPSQNSVESRTTIKKEKEQGLYNEVEGEKVD